MAAGLTYFDTAYVFYDGAIRRKQPRRLWWTIIRGKVIRWPQNYARGWAYIMRKQRNSSFIRVWSVRARVISTIIFSMPFRRISYLGFCFQISQLLHGLLSMLTDAHRRNIEKSPDRFHLHVRKCFLNLS